MSERDENAGIVASRFIGKQITVSELAYDEFLKTVSENGQYVAILPVWPFTATQFVAKGDFDLWISRSKDAGNIAVDTIQTSEAAGLNAPKVQDKADQHQPDAAEIELAVILGSFDSRFAEAETRIDRVLARLGVE